MLREETSRVKFEKNPKYDLAFYFKCEINVASRRRWKDLKKKIPLSEVKKSLQLRTRLDKNRLHSPLKKVKFYLNTNHKLNKSQMVKKMVDEIEKRSILKFKNENYN